jgi:transcriptional regulator with XRE-family HTH domain
VNTAIPAARAIGRAKVTARPKPATTDEFRTFLRHLMDQAGFDTFESLARAGRFDATTLTRWFNGEQKPSNDLLHKIAGPLRVRFGDLLVAAGIATPQQLGMEVSPGPVLPLEVRELLDELDGAPQAEVRAVLAQVRHVADFYRTVRPVRKEPKMRDSRPAEKRTRR